MLNQPVHILISSAGRRVGLMQCFRRSAKDLGINLKIIAIDATPELSAACAFADHAIKVPLISSPDFQNAIYKIFEEFKVHLLVPTIDPELLVYGKMKLPYPITDLALIEIFFDKFKTTEFLKSHEIGAPETYNLNSSKINFPCFLKPRKGSASRGAFKAEFEEDFRKISNQDYVIQELLYGEEYTVNLYFDKQGIARCLIPHLRQETRSGELSKGITRRVPDLEAMGWKFAKILEGRVFGPLCFQAMKNNQDQWCIFDVNPRFGGGYPLAHEAGAKFTEWLLTDSFNLESRANNYWKQNVQILRYDEAVFREQKSRIKTKEDIYSFFLSK